MLTFSIECIKPWRFTCILIVYLLSSVQCSLEEEQILFQMPSHSKNKLYQKPVRKYYWPMRSRSPEDPESTELRQHRSTRTQVLVETGAASAPRICNLCAPKAVLTGNTTRVPETRLTPAVAPIKSSCLSPGTSVTFAPRQSQKQLLHQLPREWEPDISFACSGLWGWAWCLAHSTPGAVCIL